LSTQDFFNYLDSQTFLGVKLSTLLLIVVAIVVAVTLERLVTRYLKRFAKRTSLEPNVTNNLILTFRMLILIGVAATIVRVGGLPTEWLVAFSALGGAAVGFASTKTIGNVIAGLYLIATRPFRVGNYVRVGTVEGIVQEITINYTKILTIGKNIVSISNLQIMDRDITNYLYESEENVSLYCYNFEIGFDHSVSTTKIEEIFDGVLAQFNSMLPRKIDHMLVRSTAFERVYMIYLYVKRPEDIFVFRPRIAEEVFRRWDMERSKKSP